MTKKPDPRLVKAGGRKRPPIVLVAVNKPDPKIVAIAAVPLILDFVRRERDEPKEGTDNKGK